ncbi:unnamed protein product, partial [Symbiodinium sp. KB8]
MDLVPAPAGVPDAVALPDSAARREDLQLLENLMNEVCQEWHENEELKARVFGAEKRMFLWPGDAKGKKKQVTALAVKLNKDLLMPIVGRCLQHSLLATVPMMEKMLEHTCDEWMVPNLASNVFNKDARNMKTAVTCHRRLADRSDSQRDGDVHELTAACKHEAELRKRSRWVLAKECPISRFHAILEDEEALDEEQDAAPSEPAEDIPDDDGHESQDGESEPEALDLMLKEIDALPTPVLVEDSPMPGKTLNSPAG